MENKSACLLFIHNESNLHITQTVAAPHIDWIIKTETFIECTIALAKTKRGCSTNNCKGWTIIVLGWGVVMCIKSWHTLGESALNTMSECKKIFSLYKLIYNPVEK